MRTWKLSFAALLISQVLAVAGFGLSQPVIPLFLEEDLGLSDPVVLTTWVGITNAAPMFFMAIFAPIWGHLADVFSRRAMLLRAVVCGALMVSLMGFVNTPLQFLVLRAVQGAISGTVAAATVLTAGIAPVTQVAFALGLLQTGIAVGNSIGPMIGGLISDFMSFRAVFFAAGICLGISGLIVLIGVEEGAKPVKKKKREKFTLIPDFRPIFASPVLITLMLVSLGLYTGIAITIPMLPLFIRELILGAYGEASLVASTTGMVLGVGAAFTALAAGLVGKVSARLGYWQTLILCLCAGALLTIPQAIVSSVVQLTILRAASSFFIGGAIPVVNAIIAVSSEREYQGTVYGVNTSLAAAGFGLGPLIGSATAMMGFRWMFVASAIVLGLTAITAARRKRAPG